MLLLLLLLCLRLWACGRADAHIRLETRPVGTPLWMARQVYHAVHTYGTAGGDGGGGN